MVGKLPKLIAPAGRERRDHDAQQQREVQNQQCRHPVVDRTENRGKRRSTGGSRKWRAKKWQRDRRNIGQAET